MPASGACSGASSAWDFVSSSLNRCSVVNGFLQRLMPCVNVSDLLIELPHAISEIVVLVVGLDLVERTLKLALTIFQLFKDRFNHPSPLGHLTDLLAQGLLTAADVAQPLLHVDGLVAAPLQCSTLLGLGELLVEGGNGFLGIAARQMLHGRVEVLLRPAGECDLLLRALDAAAQ